MVSIPDEAFYEIIIIFLSGVLGLLLKNTWDTVKTRSCIKRIEGRLGIAENGVDENTKKIEKLGTDVTELQTKDKIYHNSAVHPPAG